MRTPVLAFEEHFCLPVDQAVTDDGRASILKGMKNLGYEENYEVLILDDDNPNPVRFKTINEVRAFLKENNCA